MGGSGFAVEAPVPVNNSVAGFSAAAGDLSSQRGTDTSPGGDECGEVIRVNFYSIANSTKMFFR